MLQPLQLNEVLNRYPEEIAELRAFLHAARIPVATPDALPLTAARLGVDRAFHRDLISMIWVVIDSRHHQISYADLLGILAIAAAGPQGAAAAPEDATHTLLRFLMEARHSLDADPPQASATPGAASAETPITPPIASQTAPQSHTTTPPIGRPQPEAPSVGNNPADVRVPPPPPAAGTRPTDPQQPGPRLVSQPPQAAQANILEEEPAAAPAQARAPIPADREAPTLYHAPVPRRYEPEEPIKRAPSKAFWAAVAATAIALAFVIFYATRRTAPTPSQTPATAIESAPAATPSTTVDQGSYPAGAQPGSAAAPEAYPAATPQQAAAARQAAHAAAPGARPQYAAPGAPYRQSYPTGAPPASYAQPNPANTSQQPASNTAARPYAQGTSNPPQPTNQTTASLPSFRPAPTGGGLGTGAAASTARPGAPVVRSSPNGATQINIRGAAKPSAPASPVTMAANDLSTRVGARTMPTDVTSYGIDSNGRKHPELKHRNPDGSLVASSAIPPNTVLRKSSVRASSEGVMSANLISSPAPAYPAAANIAGVQGEVRVRASIDRDGNVASVRIISGPPLLRDAALDAVQHWRFRPLTAGGKALPSSATAIVEFELQ